MLHHSCFFKTTEKYHNMNKQLKNKNGKKTVMFCSTSNHRIQEKNKKQTKKCTQQSITGAKSYTLKTHIKHGVILLFYVFQFPLSTRQCLVAVLLAEEYEPNMNRTPNYL